MIKIKRAYDPEEKDDGYRILVDRLWPRGIKKSELAIDEWAKELAPSAELRRRFSHDPSRWNDFKKSYRMELRSAEARSKIDSLAMLARRKTVTLIYSARDIEHNNAVVLKEVLDSKTLRKAA